MKALSHRRALCVLAACVGLGGLLPATADAASPPRSTYVQHQPVRRSIVPPKLTYRGGPVLGHVKVDVVVWGKWSYTSAVPLKGPRSISSFLGGITASKYVDWLSEYDTPTQHIGRGSIEGVYTVHPPAADDHTTVTSGQITHALHALINAGNLPKPSAGRLYVVFFRSGQVISTPFGNSQNDFCAYHDTMTHGSSTAYFAVMPYEVNTRGCRPASTTFDSVTTVVSHELVEAITDPGVGLDRLAWYDRNNGEIGDICAGVSAPASVTGGDGVGYVVQREWSNRSHACIATR